MENTSATTLGERNLHDERGYIDDDPDGLVSHELAHQWFGDLVTCRDWAHVWLNEGFASYFEALWDEKKLGAEDFAWNMRDKAREAIDGGREHPIVWRGYQNPDVQFDSRAYPKGAWVLHMIRRRLGDELFWKVMKTYTERFSFQSIETSDFRKTIEEVTHRNFERFFYDWTERPGSPEVTVSYAWLPEDSLARVKVTQTQKANPFHFPLEIEFGFADETKPHRIAHDVTARECTFYVPLAAQPRRVRIDPDFAVLMTLKREQPRGQWIEQLSDPNPIARAEAVAYFANSGTDGDIERLAHRLREDEFWGVQATIAAKLGEDLSDTSRDALLGVLDAKNAKVRVAAVQALGKFAADAEVEAALAGVIKKGDPSYGVEAAAIRAHAAIHQGDDSDVLAAALARDSDREVIRTAALEALGENGEAKSINVIGEWARKDKPMECRSAAIRAMAKLISREKLSEIERKTAMECIEGGLAAHSIPLQRAALGACGDLGDKAVSLIPRIEKLTKATTGRTRRSARQALEKIRKAQPADSQLVELQAKVTKLMEENKRIREKLEEIQARESGNTHPPEPQRKSAGGKASATSRGASTNAGEADDDARAGTAKPTASSGR